MSMQSVCEWLVPFFSLMLVIGILAYQLMCLVDLEFDYMNPYDSASRVNKVALFEIAPQGILCLFYLATRHWSMLLMSLPYLYYNVRLYMSKKHLVDVTEIFNQLPWEKKQRLYKLGYCIFLLFLYLFWTIWSVLDDYE
ncbi:protein cornichon homolog 4-like [Malania oleifera]|uniref:protein cornichon homolog 4-like n=1 Tax=Malania oleifera TaxID=397392 RepID=UPI0025AE3990|nr:protein cornichon homolog 4-like [Malania oleifera]